MYKLINPDLPGTYQVHHTLPQKYVNTMSDAGINVHELKYLRGVDEKIHSKITYEWAKWHKSVEGNPTTHQVIDFATKIDEKFGRYWYNKQ